MQVEIRRFWVGLSVEQMPSVDMLLLLRTGAQDIVLEILFASMKFICL